MVLKLLLVVMRAVPMGRRLRLLLLLLLVRHIALVAEHAGLRAVATSGAGHDLNLALEFLRGRIRGLRIARLLVLGRHVLVCA